MKISANTANARRAHIQTLLYLGKEPKLKVLEKKVAATRVCAQEAHWIRKHRSQYLLNCAPAGGGVKARPMTVYALCDPRDGKIFYVGVATNATVRFKQHLKDALKINALVDRVERHRLRWTRPERELIYGGADIQLTAKALGRSVAAVRSHLNLSISSTGFASTYIIEDLRAARNMRRVGKLKTPPSIVFHDAPPSIYAKKVTRDLLAFAKSL